MRHGIHKGKFLGGINGFFKDRAKEKLEKEIKEAEVVIYGEQENSAVHDKTEYNVEDPEVIVVGENEVEVITVEDPKSDVCIDEDCNKEFFDDVIDPVDPKEDIITEEELEVEIMNAFTKEELEPPKKRRGRKRKKKATVVSEVE